MLLYDRAIQIGYFQPKVQVFPSIVYLLQERGAGCKLSKDLTFILGNGSSFLGSSSYLPRFCNVTFDLAQVIINSFDADRKRLDKIPVQHNQKLLSYKHAFTRIQLLKQKFVKF